LREIAGGQENGIGREHPNQHLADSFGGHSCHQNISDRLGNVGRAAPANYGLIV
jgi:hypothetical protein